MPSEDDGIGGGIVSYRTYSRVIKEKEDKIADLLSINKEFIRQVTTQKEEIDRLKKENLDYFEIRRSILNHGVPMLEYKRKLKKVRAIVDRMERLTNGINEHIANLPNSHIYNPKFCQKIHQQYRDALRDALCNGQDLLGPAPPEPEKPNFKRKYYPTTEYLKKAPGPTPPNDKGEGKEPRELKKDKKISDGLKKDD